jgi:hypothetical protein
MLDARTAYKSLLESGKIDALLADAAALTSKVAAAAPKAAADIDATLAAAANISADLRKHAANAAAERDAKVAAVIHLGRVATRLLA